MSHGDKITAIPPGFEVVATSEASPYAVIADEKRRFYGVQFHPEVVHTPRGATLLANFVRTIAGIEPEWNMHAFRAAHGGENPQAGRQGQGDLRPVGRRGFLRRRRADP